MLQHTEMTHSTCAAVSLTSDTVNITVYKSAADLYERAFNKLGSGRWNVSCTLILTSEYSFTLCAGNDDDAEFTAGEKMPLMMSVHQESYHSLVIWQQDCSFFVNVCCCTACIRYIICHHDTVTNTQSERDRHTEGRTSLLCCCILSVNPITQYFQISTERCHIIMI